MKQLNKWTAHFLLVGLAAYSGLSACLAQNVDHAWLNEKKEILRYLTLVDLDDGAGGSVRTIRVSGVNLQIVNGLGATNGNPLGRMSLDPSVTKTNGAGNLIVWYNDLFFSPLEPDPVRTGSHNIVGGASTEFTSFGGIVFGQESKVNGAYSSVLGGINNAARGNYSVVVGGGGFQSFGSIAGNVAEGDRSTIVGGATNVALGQLSFVGGGLKNRIEGTIGNSIVGGESNFAGGSTTVVSGGRNNRAEGPNSHVCGGEGNRAIGNDSCVSGGLNRNAVKQHDWRAGNLEQEQ